MENDDSKGLCKPFKHPCWSDVYVYHFLDSRYANFLIPLRFQARFGECSVCFSKSMKALVGLLFYLSTQANVFEKQIVHGARSIEKVDK
jgi:hypothetical protein